MHRHALRDDEWDKIKDFLPGRVGHVGRRRRTIACSSMSLSFAIAPALHGVICRSVSAKASPFIVAFADGA